jgi:hypothetical protein
MEKAAVPEVIAYATETYDFFRYLAMRNVISRTPKMSATQRRTSRPSKDKVPHQEVTLHKKLLRLQR